MKKTFSLILSIVVLLSTFSVFSTPVQAAEYEPDKKIYANAYMLISLDDSKYPIVSQKNKDERKYPASLTKIVTSIVALKKVSDLKQKVTMSQTVFDDLQGTGAQVAGIKVGKELTVEKLLELTMVYSACDAADMLAEYVGGSKEKFVAMMNQYVKDLGCKNTHFTNASGLHDSEHYTTAQDMATITLDAMKNEKFMNICTQLTVDYNKQTFYHTNLMLQRGYLTYYYEYAQGIKTGSTEEAGYNVIVKASKDGYNYLAIVMDSPRKKIKHQSYETKCSFVDAKTLFEWAFSSLKYDTVVKQNTIASEVKINNGKDADTVQLVAQKDLNTIVPASLDPSSVLIEPVNQPEVIEAPVTKGDVICTAKVIYAGQTIDTINLVASKTVELSTFLKLINAIKAILTNKIVLMVLAMIFVGFVGYLWVFMSRLQKNKERMKQKRMEQRSHDGDDVSGDHLSPPRPHI